MVPRLTQAGHPETMPVLVEVFEAEAEARRQRRITRLRRASRLPPGKTFATLDTGRFPAPVAQLLETLATGAFLETAANVLAFGLPGVGKSHALCAVGHALVEAGHSGAFSLDTRPWLWVEWLPCGAPRPVKGAGTKGVYSCLESSERNTCWLQQLRSPYSFSWKLVPLGKKLMPLNTACRRCR